MASPAPRFSAAADEVVTVQPVALDGDEDVARRDRPAVDRHAVERALRLAREPAAGRRQHLVAAPQVRFSHERSSIALRDHVVIAERP